MFHLEIERGIQPGWHLCYHCTKGEGKAAAAMERDDVGVAVAASLAGCMARDPASTRANASFA